MLLVVLVVLSFPGGSRAIEARRDDLAATSARLASTIVAPALEGVGLSTPLDPAAAGRLAERVEAGVTVDPHIEIVRIWAPDSTLLWSSVDGESIGSAAGLNDEAVTTSLADLSAVHTQTAERDLNGQPSEATFSAYAPVSVGGELAAVQFEASEATAFGDVRSDWLRYRLIFGVAVLVGLALALGSMREPVARIGAGVPFYSTSVPRAMDVIDLDRKIELERAGVHARERVANMEARIRESEGARLKLEGDLQRALTQIANKDAGRMRSVIATSKATPSDAPTAPAVPAPAPSAPPAPTPTAPPTPPPAPVAPAATPPTAPPAPPTPVTPAASAQTASPAPAPPAPTPAAADADRASRRAKVSKTPTSPTRTRTPREPRRPARADATGADAPVVVPDAEPSTDARPADLTHEERVAALASLAAFEVDDDSDGGLDLGAPVVLPPSEVVRPAEDEHEATSMLERLVEPVGAHPVASGEEASVMRAKLARTAARKKQAPRQDDRVRDGEENPGR